MRSFVLLLLIANAGYFAWTSGWLRDWGLAPATQTEPQRLAQQIRPEALRILGTGTRTGVVTDPAENTPAPVAITPAVSPPLPIMTSRVTTTTSNMTIRTPPSAPPAATTGAATVAAAVLAATSAAAAASAPVASAASAASAAAPSTIARPTDDLRPPTPSAAAERPQ